MFYVIDTLFVIVLYYPVACGSGFLSEDELFYRTKRYGEDKFAGCGLLSFFL